MNRPSYFIVVLLCLVSVGVLRPGDCVGETLKVFNGQSYPINIAVAEGLSRGTDPVLVKDMLPSEVVRAEDAYVAKGWWTVQPSSMTQVTVSTSKPYIRISRNGFPGISEAPPIHEGQGELLVNPNVFAVALFPNRERSAFAYSRIRGGAPQTASDRNALLNAGWRTMPDFYRVRADLVLEIGNFRKLVRQPYAFAFSSGSAPKVFVDRFTVPTGAVMHDAKYEESHQKYLDSVQWAVINDAQNRPIGYSVLGSFKPPWHGQTSGGRYRGVMTLSYSFP